MNLYKITLKGHQKWYRVSYCLASSVDSAIEHLKKEVGTRKIQLYSVEEVAVSSKYKSSPAVFISHCS